LQSLSDNLARTGRFGVPVAMDSPFLVSGVQLADGSKVYRIMFRDP
jgi:hypothetical protein